MKIAIYGVSRAGKDYLIGNVIKSGAPIFHLRGSETLKRLSQVLLNKPFAETDEEEKNKLRTAFTREAAEKEREYGNVAVDGHYAFPDDNGGYRIAFTEADRTLYDVFVYLKPKTARIIENQKALKDGKPVRQYDESQLEEWEEFEIRQMQAICKQLDKELIVLDGDVPVCAEFLCALIANPSVCEQRRQIGDILARHAKTLEKVGTIVVSDCDRTISVKDTGDFFCRYVGLERSAMKEIFKGDYYSIYQFYKWKKLVARYTGDGSFSAACDFAIANTAVNQKLINDICSENVLTVGVTTGLTEIWEAVRKTVSFPQILIGNTVQPTNLIISATAKRILVEELQKAGKKVIAIGDGVLDMPMLEAADGGFIVAEDKLSNSVIKYLAEHKPKVRQLSYSRFKYENAEVVNSVWE